MQEDSETGELTFHYKVQTFHNELGHNRGDGETPSIANKRWRAAYDKAVEEWTAKRLANDKIISRDSDSIASVIYDIAEGK